MAPTARDVLAALELVEDNLWVEPGETPISWHCRVYDREGCCIGNGDAEAPGLAMGMAWICACATDALTSGTDLEGVPLVVPSSFRFELVPPPPLGRLPFQH